MLSIKPLAGKPDHCILEAAALQASLDPVVAESRHLHFIDEVQRLTSF